MSILPSSAGEAATRLSVLAVALASGCHSGGVPAPASSAAAIPPHTEASAAPVSVAAVAPPPPSSAAPLVRPPPTGATIDFSAMNAAAAGTKPLPSCAPLGKGVRYDIGSARTPTFDDVPWTSLAPGDVICVPYRPEPYRAKIYFVTRGARGAPIRLVGLRGPHGERPIIDGDRATTSRLITPSENDKRMEPAGVISMVTHFISPKGAPWSWHPGWITLTGLKIQHARPEYTFTNSSGKPEHYGNFSAAVYINPGDDVIVEDCEITDSGLGVFAKSFEKVPGHEDMITDRLTLRGNYIHDNGDTKTLSIHNVYVEGHGCNIIGNTMIHKAGNVGVNYKSRCSHERIFGNRIEGGYQGLLVLIDPQSGWDTLGVAADFEPTVVAGNLLVNPYLSGVAGTAMINFGADSYTDAGHYRTHLIVYANTILNRSHGGGRIPVLGLTYLTKEKPSLKAWFSTNLLDNSGDGTPGAQLQLALRTGVGHVAIDHSFIDPTSPEYDEYDTNHGTISGWAALPRGTAAGIPGGRAEPRPVKGSRLIDAGVPFTSLPAESLASTVTDFALYEPQGPIDDPWYRVRPVHGAVDIGAYEADP